MIHHHCHFCQHCGQGVQFICEDCVEEQIHEKDATIVKLQQNADLAQQAIHEYQAAIRDQSATLVKCHKALESIPCPDCKGQGSHTIPKPHASSYDIAQTEPVTCKHCAGTGIHPKARKALK